MAQKGRAKNTWTLRKVTVLAAFLAVIATLAIALNSLGIWPYGAFIVPTLLFRPELAKWMGESMPRRERAGYRAAGIGTLVGYIIFVLAT